MVLLTAGVTLESKSESALLPSRFTRAGMQRICFAVSVHNCGSPFPPM